MVSDMHMSKRYICTNIALSDLVVAESVSVIKRLLQIRGNDNKPSIIRLAKLLDTTTVPVARANIFWLVGQYADNINTVAPDILRKAVKGFADEVLLFTLTVCHSQRYSHIHLFSMTLLKPKS
jgi:vesicle coat complex subunit